MKQSDSKRKHRDDWKLTEEELRQLERIWEEADWQIIVGQIQDRLNLTHV